MICPQCGKHYAQDEGVCRLCGVSLQAPPPAAAQASGEDFVRPSGIDQTFKAIRQDIDTIDHRPVKPAGFFIRVLASCIDNILLTLITLVVACALFIVLERGGVSVSLEPDKVVTWFLLLFCLPNMVLSCAYLVYFHAVTGQTVGKLICGVQVVTAAENNALGWWRSIVRCAVYFLCSAFIYIGFIGFLWVLFNRRKRAWHDYLAGSVVIYKEK